MTNKIILAVFVAMTAAACQADEPSARVFRVDAAEEIAIARCQRYADCAFGGDAGQYYDQCVYWTKIAICDGSHASCVEDATTYAADDVDACASALSAQACRGFVDGVALTACAAFTLH